MAEDTNQTPWAEYLGLSTKHYPEFAYIEALERQDEAKALVEKHFGGGLWGYFAFVIVGALPGILIVQLYLTFAYSSTGGLLIGRHAETVLLILIVSLYAGGVRLISLHIFRNRVRRRLRELLISNGVPICLKCGYDLRGQAEARCPECGTAFDEELLTGRQDAPNAVVGPVPNQMEG